jgi:tRNA/tmRNA/rRNA uracil-C5-methylase (TrmA/RlmC/RlmD family)
VVLGAGLAGLEVTTRLADEFGDEVHVTLIDNSEAFEMIDTSAVGEESAVPANQQQAEAWNEAEAWNGPKSAHFVDHADRYDRQLEPFTQALLEWARPEAHNVVLDVGCGSGASTLAAATRAGRVTGVDFSKPLVELARRPAQDADRQRRVRDR